LENIMWRNS